MIEIQNLVKNFDDIRAVDNISLHIREKQVFGLIGTNGAGKSTMLRMLCGVLKPDGGMIKVDGGSVLDCPETKEKLFFIADEPFFFRNSNAEEMGAYYEKIYPYFDRDRFYRLLDDFGLDRKRKVSGYSKGMKKQLSIILGVSCNTHYIVCDETFDGLDPVMRQGVKSIFAGDMLERGLTPIIASHNLRELEDICDDIGLMHRGGVLLSENLESMRLGIQKVQCVFNDPAQIEEVGRHVKLLQKNVRGRLCTFTIRGERAEVEAYFRGVETVFFEILPLSLEEIFISETEVAGYDIKSLILGK